MIEIKINFNRDNNKFYLNKKKLTVLISDFDKKFEWSTQNLRYVYVVNASKASTYDLLDCEILLMDKDSLLVLTTMLKV